jgi:hypothetical protein
MCNFHTGYLHLCYILLKNVYVFIRKVFFMSKQKMGANKNTLIIFRVGKKDSR